MRARREGAKRDYGRYALDSRLLQRPGSGGDFFQLRHVDRDGSGLRSADRGAGQLRRRSLDPQALFHRDGSGLDPARRRRPQGDGRLFLGQRQARRRQDRRVAQPAAKQIINRVAFEGNSKITKDQLEVEVQSKPRDAYNEATAEGDVGRIKDAYKKYGRNEAAGDQAARPAAQRTRRPRLHHRRGREDRHSRDPLRRQPRRLELSSAAT